MAVSYLLESLQNFLFDYETGRNFVQLLDREAKPPSFELHTSLATHR